MNKNELKPKEEVDKIKPIDKEIKPSKEDKEPIEGEIKEPKKPEIKEGDKLLIKPQFVEEINIISKPSKKLEKEEQIKEPESKEIQIKEIPVHTFIVEPEIIKNVENKVIIEQTKRGKKKHITYIMGLDKFGLVLKDVAKQLSKKMACSCTVTKEDNGEDSITLTGEFADDVKDFILENFKNIEEKNIQVKIDKK